MSNENPEELSGAAAINRFKELVEDIDLTMMTTVGDDGRLFSRPMSTLTVDQAGDLWFFTAEDTRKVDEVKADRDVNLGYLDARQNRWVTVAGRANIEHDRARMKELYTPALDVFFPDGLNTPGIALMRVSPVEVEFWEPREGKIAQAAHMLKALVTRDTPDHTMRRGHFTR